MDDYRKKTAIWRAIKARCLDCAGSRDAVHDCDGKMIGYECALWPYREIGLPKVGADGRMLSHFHKPEVLKAIRRECHFCCNGSDPRIACGDPNCSLVPYQRGTASFLQVAKSDRERARSGVEVNITRQGSDCVSCQARNA
jgi:hypothetical protein